MYQKQEVIEFIKSVQLEIISLDKTMSRKFIPEIDLADPDMKSILVYIQEIKDSMLDAQAIIGVLLIKLSQCLSAGIDAIEDEVGMLEDFFEMTKKIKINLEPLYLDEVY